MSLLFPLKRKCSKYQYDFTVHHLMKIPKNHLVLYIKWERGRKWQGETKRSIVTDKTAVWEEEFIFKATLFQNSKGEFKKKWIKLSIFEVRLN